METESGNDGRETAKRLMLSGDLTITDAIDAFIELNAIVGVGLITLGDDLKDYINTAHLGRKRKEA